MKKILILSNHHAYTYNFRKEIIIELINNNYSVTVVLPYGEKAKYLKSMGCKIIDLPLDRRGMNPMKDLKLLFSYLNVMRRIKPDIVMSYTIKPNTYGGIASRLLNIPFIPNVTGLGTAVENEGILQKVLIILYRIAFKRASCVFFQNEENRKFFINRKIVRGKYQLIPGSGVNLEEFPLLEYPSDDKIRFVFISRVMKEKGIEQYLEAAKYIKQKYSNTEFHICGFCEEEYEERLKSYEQKGIIIYHGMIENIIDILEKVHCTIHPTYYPEGMSNVLLESAACGKTIITTNRSGCREIVDHNINGYIIKPKDTNELIIKIEEFLELSRSEKIDFGLSGRRKVEREFDRNIVVRAYLENIKLI